MAFVQCFGTLQPNSRLKFEVSKIPTIILLFFSAWVGSLAYGLGMLCAPVSSSVINKHGSHVSVIIGCILCSISLFVSSTAGSISTLFGTYSLLYGLGIAFAYTPTMCIASDYFDKYLTAATGIMVAGSSTGTLVFSARVSSLDRFLRLEKRIQDTWLYCSRSSV